MKTNYFLFDLIDDNKMPHTLKTYKFEVLEGKSFFYDGSTPSRKVVELTNDQEREFEFALSSELYEEFEGDIDVQVIMKHREIIMKIFKPSELLTSWEVFAFRKKGIQITSEYHSRLVETI